MTPGTYRANVPGHVLDGALVEYVGENPNSDPFMASLMGYSDSSSEYRLLDVTPEIQAEFNDLFQPDPDSDVNIRQVYFYPEDVELVEAAA